MKSKWKPSETDKMKTIKILIVVAVILAIAGIFMPQDYSVNRTLVISAPIAAVQGHVEDMDNWDRWTVWDEAVPPAGVQLAQMESGVGSGKYLSGISGSGWFVITYTSAIEGFEYTFYSDAGDKALSLVTFVDQGGSVKVDWTVKGKVTKPPVLAPYLAIIKKFALGYSLNQNLKNLKTLVEQEDR
jgi:hypothetical protein